MTSDPVQFVLDRLTEHGSVIKHVQGQDLAQCPAHPDRNPSLAVAEGDDGRVLLDCKAGCRTEDVLSAIGLKESDLFAKQQPRNTLVPRLTPLVRPKAVSSHAVADYLYADADGTPVFKVTRSTQLDVSGQPVGKTFHQYRLDASGAWVPGLNGATPPLYHLPDVVATIGVGGLVLVVEGEKDAERARSLGLTATCNAMGAGKWRAEHTASLAGATVIIIADDDAPGRAHAVAVHKALEGVAASVVTALPASGCKDLSDHLDAGYGLNQVRLVRAEDLEDQAATEPTDDLHLRQATIRAYEITTDGLDAITPPEMLISDLLQRDSLAWLQGKPGSGKTFIGVDIAGSVATGQSWHEGRAVVRGRVLYVIAEGVHGLRPRVRAWEARNVVMRGVIFLPLAIQMLDRIDLGGLALRVAEIQPSLIILDTQARMSVGADENSARDMGLYVEALEQLRMASGACVLSVHHEGRGGDHMRGSTALEGAATTVMRVTKDGDALQLECVKQKESPEFETISLRLVPVESSAIIFPFSRGNFSSVHSGSETAVMGILTGSFGQTGCSPSMLIEASGLPKTTVYRAMNALLARGSVRNVGTPARPILKSNAPLREE